MYPKQEQWDMAIQMMNRVLVTLIFIMALTGCSESKEEILAKCRDVNNEKIALFIQEGLIDSSLTIDEKTMMVVGYNGWQYVALNVQRDNKHLTVGVWALRGITDISATVFSGDYYASQLSQYPDITTTKADYDYGKIVSASNCVNLK